MKFLSSVVVLFAAGALASPMLAKRQDEAETCTDPNATFKSCGTACPPTCTNPNPEICTLQCVPECQCNEGFVLNETTKTCVVSDQCPKQ